jgi:aspartate/methionine/tyrosine aminotransferase
MLERAGFRVYRPAGAYYAMTEIDGLGWDDDVAFARHLVEKVGVAVVPARRSTTTRATDGARCASRSARRTRRWTKRSGGWHDSRVGRLPFVMTRVTGARKNS